MLASHAKEHFLLPYQLTRACQSWGGGGQKLHLLQNVIDAVGITRFHMWRTTFPQVPKYVCEETRHLLQKATRQPSGWVGRAPQPCGLHKLMNPQKHLHSARLLLYFAKGLHGQTLLRKKSVLIFCMDGSTPNTQMQFFRESHRWWWSGLHSRLLAWGKYHVIYFFLYLEK